MKKYIIFAAFLSLFSCKESTFTPQPNVSAGQLLFIGANQSDCLANSEPLSIKAEDCAKINTTKFEGETLTVVVRQKAFCSSKFNLSQTITGNNITLKADDTSTEASRCTCNYDLTYTFTGAKSGLYKVDYEGKVYNNDPCKTSTTASK